MAHFSGVMLCGKVWVCPVCGPRIRQRRATDLDQACATWIYNHGPGSVMLLTLTLPHQFGQPLEDLLGTVRAAFKSLLSGRAWMDDKRRFGLAHWVRAHDITVGPNGWHPHIHMLLFGERAPDEMELSELEERLYYRWMSAVTGQGHAPPSREHGIRLERARKRADLARYVSQVISGTEDRPTSVAFEVIRGDLKTSSNHGHRTPWQILSDIGLTGSDADIRLWHEYEKATKRVHAIRWSNGLRKAVGIATEETDEEIVAEEVGGETVYQFKDYEWFRVCRTPGAQGEVLRMAEEEDASSVKPFIATLGKRRFGQPHATHTHGTKDKGPPSRCLDMEGFATRMSKHMHPQIAGGPYDQD